jgi:hypothetical protein
MENPLKIVSLALALGAVLVAWPGLAQEDTAKGTADHGAASNSAAAGAGAAAGAIKGGADLRSGDTGSRGEHSVRGMPSTAPKGQRAGLDHGINLTTPDNGYAGLQRRANRKLLVLNSAMKPSGTIDRNVTVPQMLHPKPDGAVTRNAVGMAVPGGTGGAAAVQGPTVPRGPGDPGLHRPTTVMTGRAAAAPAATHPTAINGTTITHIGAGPGVIGGPVKDRSGINGTSLRPRAFSVAIRSWVAEWLRTSWNEQGPPCRPAVCLLNDM